MKIISDISLWWCLPLFIFCVAIAWLFYFFPKRNPLFSRKIAFVLLGLRTLGLFFTGLLLMGLFFSSRTYRNEKPLLFLAVDQSESMLCYNDSNQLKQKLPVFVSQLKDKLSEKYTLKEIGFGETLSNTIPYLYQQKKTNIGGVFEHIHENYVQRNIGSVILVSDGNYNDGNQPIYAANQLKFVPIYTILVGDTVTKKDLAIQSLMTNDVAFSGSIFPIEIRAEANGFAKQTIEVQLYQNKQLIDNKKIQIENNNHFQFSHTFQVIAQGKGYQRYTVKIVSETKEYTLANNNKQCFVEIIDQRTKICLLSNGIHPDIGTIRAALMTNKHIETFVTLDPQKVIEGKFNLVVVCNPTKNYSVNLWEYLHKNKIPVLVVLGSNINSNALAQLHLGISNVANGKADHIQAHYNEDFHAIELSKTFAERIENFPPLLVPFAMTWPKNGTNLLLQKLNGNILNRPLLSLYDFGGQKMGAIYGQGIWRWKMNEQFKYGNTLATDELISKLIQYLSVKENTSKLRIFPPKNSGNADDILFRASFYNDAFQQITEPQIQLSIFNDQNALISEQTFQKNPPDYQLNLGKMKPGKYTWKAQCTFNKINYHKEGKFVVNDISMEKTCLNSNYQIMNELTENSNGKMYTLNNCSRMIDELLNRKDISVVQYEENAFYQLVDFAIIFIIIVLLLSIEWTIKRWIGAY